MVTIHHLEVTLEIDGSDEEIAFAKLFDKYIRRWNRAMETARHHACIAERERHVGASHGGDE
jgi:hypothetical protein